MPADGSLTNPPGQARRSRLAPPRLSRAVVQRPRLERRLDEALDRAVTLVIAPGGSGKTSLLARWARTAPPPVSWLSLDERDTDPRVFASDIVAALRTDAPDAAADIEPLLARQANWDSVEAGRLLADALSTLESDHCLLIDDLTGGAGEEYLQLLDELIRHPPPRLHLVLAGRSIPPLSNLARLRARHDAEIISERDLRFDREETGRLLEREAPDLSSSADDDLVQRMLDRSGGWAAGVRALIAAVAASGELPSGAPASLRTFLVNDVLRDLPAPTRDLLREIAIADQVTPDLAAAIAGIDASAASRTLDDLAERGLFISRLDGTGDAWKLHALLRDSLLDDLTQSEGQAGIERRHARAAAWYAAAGIPTTAVNHWLRSGDPAAAADSLAANVVEWIRSEGSNDTLDWVDRLPQEMITNQPALLVARASCLMTRGNVPGALVSVEQARAIIDQRDPGGNDPVMRTLRWELAAVRAMSATLGGYPATVAEELTPLISGPPDATRAARGAALGAWIIGMDQLGRGYEAIETLEGIAAVEIRSQDALAFEVLSMLGAGCLRGADIPSARRWLRQSEPMCRQPANARRAQWHAMMSATIALETLDVASVETIAREALRQAPGIVLAAKTELAHFLVDALLWQGRYDEARDVIADDRKRLELGGALRLLPDLEAVEASIDLATGDIDAATLWADRARIAIAPEATRGTEHPASIQARVLLARGSQDDTRKAIALLERLRENFETVPFRIALARMLPVLASAYAAAGYDAQAMQTTRDALDAEPGFMTWRFQVAGVRSRPLLELVAAGEDQRLAARARSVLESLPRTTAAVRPSPFTEREEDILRLLAEWRTNKEIAESLGISSNTVREYTRRIFRKLGVGDRRDAVEIAGSAGWLKQPGGTARKP